MEAAWTLCILGQPHLQDARSQPVYLERKAAGLLAYLALEGPTHRSRLAGLLWPESREVTARNNLVQLLRKLRLATQAELVQGADTLDLSPLLEVDLIHSQRLYAQGRHADFVQARGLPLEGLDFDDLPEFEDWLISARERWEGWQRAALQKLGEEAEADGDLHAALGWSEALLEADPVSEAAFRAVMRRLYLLGDRHRALEVFERCVQTLEVELGVAPLPETQELAELIRQGNALPGAAPALSGTIPLSVLRPPRLLGRAALWARMEQAWAEGKVILLSGAPGSGKSRLAHDFLSSKGRFLRADARPGDARMPYATLVRVWNQVLTDNPDLHIEGWVRRELARLFPTLGEAPPPLQGEADRLRFYEAGARFVWTTRDRYAGQLCDDIQFIDAASYELGLYAIGRLGSPESSGLPTRTIFCFRDEELPEAYRAGMDDLLRAGLAVHFQVEPLDPAAVRELLEGLDIKGIERLVGPLERLSGGNPLFILETVKHLIETGRLGAELPEKLPPPGRMVQLLETRLARLGPTALQAARAAAVLQSDFDLELVAEVLGASLLELAPAWEELEAAQIVSGERFSHDLVYEAVLAGLPASLCRVLHRSAARALEGRGAAPARIAGHWISGGSAAAAPWLLKAAEEARARLRLHEATGFLERAAEILEEAGDPDGAFGARFNEALVLAELDQPERQQRVVDTLMASARDAGQRARAWVARCYLLFVQGDVVQLEQAARSGLEEAEHAGDVEARRELLEAFAVTRILVGKPSEAVAPFEELDRLGEQHGQPLWRGKAQEGLGLVYSYGQRSAARSALERARDFYREVGYRSGEYGVLNKLGAVEFELGRYREARAHYVAAAHGMSGTDGYLEIQMISLLGQATCARATGDFASALEGLETGIALAERAQRGLGGVLLAELATLLLLLGQPQRAADALERARSWPGVPLHQMYRLELAAALVTGSLEAFSRAIAGGQEGSDAYTSAVLPLYYVPGRPWAQVLEAAEAALELARQHELVGVERVAGLRRSQALLALGRPVEARQALPDVQGLEAGLPGDLTVTEAWVIAAQVQRAVGEVPDAALEAAEAWLRRAAALLPTAERRALLSDSRPARLLAEAGVSAVDQR